MFEIVEIGHYALMLALGLSLAQVALGMWGVHKKDLSAIVLSIRSSKVVFYLVSVAFLALILSFLNNDFTLKYVALNSNAYLPWYYKVSAAWAGHEGSLLLWVWTLTLWGYFVARKTTPLPPHFRAQVMIVLGVIAMGFLSFVVLTSNPFERLLPTHDLMAPLEGKDLNPMLQDVGLILHPPLLYMGYVGFSVSFAFIVAALVQGRLDVNWVRWCRPWVMMAWVFLTLGIALGSWWAYYELGWGGWWFWDPVENASFMPWLAGTALLHSLSATEKRDVFKIWTAFLAIATFSLSLIGTFLVRSGVLTSVHAFASDPTRGVYILMLLGLICGPAFFLLLIRAHKLRSTGVFQWVSKEVGLLLNHLILSAGCLIVFIGTLTPLLYDVLGWERISIGAPYFNSKMKWVLLACLIFLTFAPYLHWKKDRLSRLTGIFSLSWGVSLLMTYVMLKPFNNMDVWAFVLLSLTLTSFWVGFLDALLLVRKQRHLPGLGYLSMSLGHLGFLVSCVGIIMASTYSVERDMYAQLNEPIVLEDVSFEARRIITTRGNQYDTTKIDFILRDSDGHVLTVLRPEKRQYHITQMPISESAIWPGLMRDVYMALGESQGDRAWSVRVQIKPYIRWVWLGAFMMALSCLFVLGDRRYKRYKKGN